MAFLLVRTKYVGERTPSSVISWATMRGPKPELSYLTSSLREPASSRLKKSSSMSNGPNLHLFCSKVWLLLPTGLPRTRISFHCSPQRARRSIISSPSPHWGRACEMLGLDWRCPVNGDQKTQAQMPIRFLSHGSIFPRVRKHDRARLLLSKPPGRWISPVY